MQITARKHFLSHSRRALLRCQCISVKCRTFHVFVAERTQTFKRNSHRMRDSFVLCYKKMCVHTSKYLHAESINSQEEEKVKIGHMWGCECMSCMSISAPCVVAAAAARYNKFSSFLTAQKRNRGKGVGKKKEARWWFSQNFLPFPSAAWMLLATEFYTYEFCIILWDDDDDDE